MPTATQVFRALITADADGAVTELKKFDGQVDKAVTGSAKKADKLSAAFTGVGKVVAGLGVAEGLRRSIDAASDLEESTNAVNQAFGAAADGVHKFGQNSSDAYGLSTRAFNEMSLGLSGFAQELSAGGAGSVSGVVDELIGRATDFGSVWNKETDEVANAFRSFLSGESEPMKAFGIIVDDAAVKARALEMGLADTTSELTNQDKILARYNLLMEETAYTAGDWARTSDGLAGSQKKLKADIENSAAALGAELLPAATDVAGVAADLTSAFASMPDAAKQFTVGAGVIAAGLATIGGKATGVLALLSQVVAETNAIDAGLKGGQSARDYLNKDVSFFEKPVQLASQFGFALGAGEWGAWRDEAGEALDAAEQAAMSFDATMLDGVDTASAARAKIDEWADSLGLSDDAAAHAANTVAVQYLPAISDAAGATSDAAREAQIASEMLRDEAKAGEHTATVMKDVADRQREAAEATERHRAAVAALFDEVNNNLSTMFDYEEASIAVEDAVKGFADAAVAALEAANDEESSLADREQALRDMRSAELDAADAALDAAGKYAESQGAIQGTTEFAMLQREELSRLADKFPELSDEIAQFIAELDRIPAVKTVSLIVNRSGTNAALAAVGSTNRVDEFGNLIAGGRANGGPVAAGSTYLVGERGPELLTMGANGYITPNNKLGGGGISIGSIVVQAPAGADADAFGRSVREAIRREIRFNGPVAGWAA